MLAKLELDNQDNFIKLLDPFISPIYMGDSHIKNEYRDIEEVAYLKNIGCILSHEPISKSENFVSLFKECDFSVNNSAIFLDTPSNFKFFDKNKEIEALAASEKGDIIAIEEFGQDKIHHKMFLWNINKPTIVKTFFYPTEYYVGVTASTFTPDGSILVVERKIIHYQNNSKCMKAFETFVNLVDADELKNSENYVFNKHRIISITNEEQNSNQFSQNFEAIDIKMLSGNINIFMLSDNGPLQETVLLQFEFL